MVSLRASATLMGFALFVLSAARLTLYLVYPKDFDALGAGELFSAFLGGLRFDLSVLLLCCSPALLMMHLPARFAHTRAWQRGWSWAAFASFAIVLLIIGGDLVYFGIVRRHVSTELSLLVSDSEFLLQTPMTYVPSALAYVGTVFVLGLVWRKILAFHRKEVNHSSHQTTPLHNHHQAIAQFVTVIALLFLGVHGTLSSEPLTAADAFRGNSFALGTLTLNGAYSAIRSTDEENLVDVPIDFEGALDELGLAAVPFPMTRSHAGFVPTGKNIVLVLLESWDVNFIDAYRETPQELTPSFDRLASEGLLFTELHSNSQRSIGAFQAAMVGLPPMSGIPIVGFGLEFTNLTHIGAIAHSHGYRTLMVQAAKRQSFSIDAIADLLGFEDYYGQEDIPSPTDMIGVPPKYGWDHETFQFALDRMEEYDEPFLTVIITGTTHSPYTDPGESFRRVPHEIRGENGYINTLAYSDWALGQFMDRARASEWYSDTVFMIGSDHPWRGAAPDDLRGSFRIPFVMLGATEPGIDSKIRSQVDFLPTMIELLGFPDPFSSFGTSLLDPAPGPAIVKRGPVMGLLSSEGQLQHSLHNRINAAAPPPGTRPETLDALERKLLSSYRIATELLSNNRWHPPVDELFSN